jgi:hypothetical protein
MNRRKFVLLGIAGAAVTSVPFAGCTRTDAAATPQFLRSLLTDAQLREIGEAYRKRFPSESTAKILRSLVEPSLPSINEVIAAEFRQGRIVVINGWILSETEGRQAALYSLNP